MAYSNEFILKLEDLAFIYITECCSHKKEQLSNKGEVMLVMDRHIPTIDYFLRIWIPLIRKEKSIVRSTYYEWLQSDDQIKSNTIKRLMNFSNPWPRILLPMKAREYSTQRTVWECMIANNSKRGTWINLILNESYQRL